MFGKRHRSRKLDLACPSCGHPQQEPARVVSSFCRACGEHFRVSKGVAVAYPGLRVSGIAELGENRRGRTEDRLPALAIGVVEEEEFPHGLEAASGEESAMSAGAFFGFAAVPDEAPSPPEPTHPGIGIEAESRVALGQGSMAALIGAQRTVVLAEREKMPPNFVPSGPQRRRDEAVPEIPVRCYGCHHVQQVSRYAKSTQCERCCTYISLAHYEIRTVKSHTLRTRGDIVVGRKGGLVDGSEIACRNLLVNGAIDATVDCTGDAVFRHSGTVRGRLHCERLVVEKGCEVRFPDGAMTERAEISGRFIGDLVCSGKALVARTGVVEGDLAAVEVDLKEGGRISGETRLDPATSTVLPLRKDFNPAVIG